MAALCVALSGSAAAEFAKDIAGTWTLVSNVIERPDGSKVQPFGPNPMGIFMLDGSGHFTIMISRTDIPKFPPIIVRMVQPKKTRQRCEAALPISALTSQASRTG